MGKILMALFVSIFAFTSISCATIVHGTTTTVHINSCPTGATAVVGGQTLKTPSTITLKNNQAYQILFKKDGYEDAYFMIDREMSGWVCGNIVFGGIIGLVVDNANGAAFKLVPTQINVSLAEQCKLPAKQQ